MMGFGKRWRVPKEALPSLRPMWMRTKTMGETKCGQLLDVRNLETTEKLGAYHVIASTVSAEALFQSGGVITQGGKVPL
jgi:hypothetical protein